MTIEHVPDVKSQPVVLRTEGVTTGLGRWKLPLAFRRIEKELGAKVVYTTDESEETILEAVKKHRPTIITGTYMKVTKRCVEEGKPEIKAVVKTGCGIDALDIKGIKETGVPLVNMPEYGAPAVAEHTLAMLMSLTRSLPMLTKSMKDRNWCDPDLPGVKGVDLCGKTCGIIGLGHIGSHFAMLCLGLRMRVVACDPAVDVEVMKSLGVVKMGMEELVEHSDVIGLFMPLSEDTRGIFDASLIGRMKKTAYLVNSARGALVDEKALVDAILERRIAGAGLDVFSKEPLSEDHPLAKLTDLPNVVLTPHVAGWSDGAWDKLEGMVFETIREILQGEKPTVYSTDPRLQNQPGCRYGTPESKACLREEIEDDAKCMAEGRPGKRIKV